MMDVFQKLIDSTGEETRIFIAYWSLFLLYVIFVLICFLTSTGTNILQQTRLVLLRTILFVEMPYSMWFRTGVDILSSVTATVSVSALIERLHFSPQYQLTHFNVISLVLIVTFTTFRAFFGRTVRASGFYFGVLELASLVPSLFTICYLFFLNFQKMAIYYITACILLISKRIICQLVDIQFREWPQTNGAPFQGLSQNNQVELLQSHSDVENEQLDQEPVVQDNESVEVLAELEANSLAEFPGENVRDDGIVVELQKVLNKSGENLEVETEPEVIENERLSQEPVVGDNGSVEDLTEHQSMVIIPTELPGENHVQDEEMIVTVQEVLNKSDGNFYVETELASIETAEVGKQIFFDTQIVNECYVSLGAKVDPEVTFEVSVTGNNPDLLNSDRSDFAVKECFKLYCEDMLVDDKSCIYNQCDANSDVPNNFESEIILVQNELPKSKDMHESKHKDSQKNELENSKKYLKGSTINKTKFERTQCKKTSDLNTLKKRKAETNMVKNLVKFYENSNKKARTHCSENAVNEIDLRFIYSIY